MSCGNCVPLHRNNETFPRLADPLGYVDKEDIFHAVKAIVATQRDYGRRDDRKQARLKYLVDEWGIDKFRCGGGGGEIKNGEAGCCDFWWAVMPHGTGQSFSCIT